MYDYTTYCQLSPAELRTEARKLEDIAITLCDTPARDTLQTAINQIKELAEAKAKTANAPKEIDGGNEKVTIVLTNTFGLTVVRHARLRKIKTSRQNFSTKHAVFYVLKGKRNVSGFALTDFAIGKGWQDIKVQSWEDDGEAMTVNHEAFKPAFEQLKNVIYTDRK